MFAVSLEIAGCSARVAAARRVALNDCGNSLARATPLAACREVYGARESPRKVRRAWCPTPCDWPSAPAWDTVSTVPIYRLTDELVFPAPQLAAADGLLAVGGDLRPERLLLAYANGIFPWPHEGYPLLWFSPDPRMILRTGDLRVSRRLARTIRQHRFDVRLDTECRAVIEGCATIARRGEAGTWITPDVVDAYTRLHGMGFVHSAEAWLDGRLVGGVYGVSLGGAFMGESMFARSTGASKVALAALVCQLDRWRIDLFDAQVYTAHVAGFGASEWSRVRYLTALRSALDRPTRRGRWTLDPDLA
jgi:leucyl/phenylalanyl-tRNA---protein transferase